MEEVEQIEVHDFSDKEKQWITAMVGVCSVCGCAAYLQNPWVMLGLVPVAVIVWAMREVPPVEMVIGPEHDQVFLPAVPREDLDRALAVYKNRDAGVSPEDVNL